jgi:hypothetical protein
MLQPRRALRRSTTRWALALVALAMLAGGCSRKFWRKRADDDVTGVITQKNVFPEWGVKNWHVYPHPDARYADTSNPDHPPYPPDDFAARVLSPNPQAPKKKYGAGRIEGDGYLQILQQWDAVNRAEDAPPPLPPPFKLDKPAERLPEPKEFPGGPGAKLELWQPWQIAAALRSEGPMGPPTRFEMIHAQAKLPDFHKPGEQGFIVISAEVPDGDKTIPAVIAIPTTQDGARKDDGAKGDGPMAMVATGDAAADFFKALETNETRYRIKFDQAIELGLLNSREFQDRREDLYLAALPVTLERFNFAAQGFFTEQAVMDFAGRALDNTRTTTFNTAGGFRKLFPTGALLLVKLANSVVVDLTGDRPTTTLSNLTVNLSQPFLRGGGRAVALEPLTLAERNLLYAIRSYARFRKLFYVAIAAGGNITNNPYSFQGLSVNLGRGIGGNLTAPSVGYLPLLLQTATIANQRRNVAALENLLRLYQAFREGGQQSDLQVSQVEQQLLQVRNSVLGSSNVTAAGGGGANPNGGLRAYLDAIDNFKLQLGLPLTVGLELDQTPLKPISDQLARFDAVYAQVREVEALARRYDPAAPAAQLRPRYRQLLTDSALVRSTPFAKTIGPRWAEWEKLTADQLTKRMADVAEKRRKLLDQRADRLLKGTPESPAETRRIEALDDELDLGTFERAMRGYEAQAWLKEQGLARATVQAAAFRDVFNAFFQLILEARNDRLEEIRRQWPALPSLMVDGVNLLDVPLDDAMVAGMQTALSHRLDLMNSRAQVVDAWRQIKVQANSLQGVFNVQYNLGAGTPNGGSNPFAFSGARTDHQLVFSGELPLVRRAERNNYRAALISYQRQRRTLQAFEDNISNDVRSDIRELRTINELYRVQQRLIELGYFQVDNAEALLLQPPAPGAQTDAGSAAALTQQVLGAQTSLLSAQNQLYTLWVNYAVSRMTLYLDLEAMQIDERGVWCNESLPGNEAANGPQPEPRGERLPAPKPLPGAGQR